MKQIGNFKVINHKPKSNISYPLIRLPQNYAYLAGEMAHVYLIETNDKPAFVISFDEHFDVDQFVQLKSKFSLEGRVEAVEKQLEILLKSISVEPEMQSGPGEIRTPDLHRVKALHADFSSKIEDITFEQSNDLNAFWMTHKDTFNKWLQLKDISERTKQNYLSSLARFFEKNEIHKPNEFRGLELKDKEARGLRNLINYCEDEEIDNVCGFTIEKWRRFIKIKKSGVVEVYVTDKEIKEAYEACPDEIKPIYNLLVYSGNRLTHIYKMLQNFDERNIIIDGDVAYYPTASLSKGTKRTFQVFFPASCIPMFKAIGNLRSYYNLTENVRHGRVCAKTIRKWHLNLMIKEGVTESLADFIQGRAPATVGSAHYLNKVQQAKDEYRRIMGKFCF